ncbi:hypothetical protein F2P56_004061 [Juglans regia]|uniref:Uncharacterized protein LOC108995742 n=2 Tax=Juglans regia TaxID=51240 RepID=A0A2I4F5J2_JUGRE|nr:uncharacterized protein LOC108995742 [Juglans regia]KAF5477421.1 hypothetical protein F2P56_004061 [Juglans regia]
MKIEVSDLLWEKLIEKLNGSKLEEVAIVMRGLWLRRNESIFEDKFKSPSQVRRIAKHDMTEYQQAQHTDKASLRMNDESCSKTIRWEKPRPGYVKSNWDATIDKKEMKVGIGVVIGDEDGEMLIAVEGQKYDVDQPVVAEAHALRKALDVCRELSFDKVLFKGDAQVFIKTVNNASEDLSFYGSLIEGMKQLLKHRTDWIVQFTHRTNNGAAHTLAKESLSLQSELIWIEDIHDCIQRIVESESYCND